MGVSICRRDRLSAAASRGASRAAQRSGALHTLTPFVTRTFCQVIKTIKPHCQALVSGEMRSRERIASQFFSPALYPSLLIYFSS